MSLENEIFIHSNVGILNTEPIHTLDIGANVRIDEYGSNTFHTSGNIHAHKITGDAVVIAGTVSATQFIVGGSAQTNIAPALQTVAEKTPFSADRTMTLSHPTTGVIVNTNVRALTVLSNVAGENVHTTGDIMAGPVSNPIFYVKSSTSKVGINEVAPAADLHVTGNAYVSSNLTVDTDTLYADAVNDRVGINKIPTTALDVSGVATFDDDLIVDTDTLHVDISTDRVGVNKLTPDASLHVVGNAYVSSNVTVNTDTLYVDATNNRIGINKIPTTALDVSGVATFDDDLIVDTDTLHVDISTERVGINKLEPDASLHVVGNAYVSSNLTVDTNTLHVDILEDRVGINKLVPDASLHVVGNAYVSSDFSHGGLLPSSGTEIDQIQKYTKTLNVTSTWMDAGISAAQLATGTYIVQLHAHEEGTANFNEYYSGLMSWYSGATDSSESSEIALHAAGKDPNSNHTYLRVTRLPNPNTLKLEIRKDVAIGSTKSYVFQFRRMI
jgi:hypothetical protein